MHNPDKLEQLEFDASIGITKTRIFLYAKDRVKFANSDYGFHVKELTEPNQKKGCWCLVDWSNPEPGTIAHNMLEIAQKAN